MALTRPTASQIITTSADFSDPLIVINKDQTGTNDKDIGFVFERGSDTNVAIIWDESADQFALINTTETGTTTGNVAISSYANLTISALVSSGLTYPTSDGTNGQVLQTNGSGTLSFVDISTNLGIAGDSGTDTVSLLNDTLTFSGTANEITTAVTDNTVTIGLPSSITTDVTGNLTGNADTASAWASARTITLGGVLSGNVSIDGSGDVTLTAAHTADPVITLTGDVTGSATMTNLGNVSISTTVAANSVALGTDTTGNYVASITNGNYITGGNGGSEGAGLTLAVDATTTNTASKVVARDASGDFSAGTITATLSGTATTATNVTTTNNTAENATLYPTFVDGTSGAQGIEIDSTGLTYNPSTNTLTTTNFAGQATTAKYADLAENYLADQVYPVGTVLQIGGPAEVTVALEKNYGVVGTVSENPGYLMNSELSGEHVTPVAYIGRVPCRVKGIVRRGELLVVSDTPGVAITKDPREILPGQLVGKALQEYTNDGEGTIEILVGRL